jgi:hypothetical protein
MTSKSESRLLVNRRFTRYWAIRFDLRPSSLQTVVKGQVFVFVIVVNAAQPSVHLRGLECT